MMMNFSSPPTPPHHQQIPVSIPSLTPPAGFPYSALPLHHHQQQQHHSGGVSAAEISHHFQSLLAAQQQQPPRPINFYCAPQPKVNLFLTFFFFCLILGINKLTDLRSD
jgi:hypothetical protein